MLGRVAPIVASLLMHAGVAGMIALAPGWTAVSESVLFLDLVEAPAPPPPVDHPKPAAPDRRPLTLPRPIQTPTPKMDTPAPAVAPPEPDPVAPAPPLPSPPLASEPAAPAPASAAAAVPSAPTPSPSDAAVSMPASPLPTAMSLPPPSSPLATAPPRTPAASEAPGPAVASVPRDGVTQAAAPRGGYQHRPTYPASARRAGVQGTTLLSVFVASDGRVGDVQVKESAGHPDLDRAAADAVRRWRFEPARRGTEAVAMWVLLPVEFRLR